MRLSLIPFNVFPQSTSRRTVTYTSISKKSVVACKSVMVTGVKSLQYGAAEILGDWTGR
jgi:hypothetical protein